jgi:hypothetical protein
MSLGRLLAAGKSLVGVHDNESRYRMGKQGALPKFGSPKNPFASPAGPTAGNDAAPRPSPEESAAAHLKETQKLPATAPVRGAVKLASLIPPGRPVRAIASEWAARLSPMRFRAGDKLVLKPGPVRLSNAPVQGELSLDKVKVVRNDLTDADLEVVRVRPALPKGEPLLPAVAGGAAESPWVRFATRILGAT